VSYIVGEQGVQQTECLDGLFHPFFLVPPPSITWLVDNNPAKLFRHRFAVKGILKNADGTWIEDKDWLCLNRPIYDASYQITALTEKQASEQLYLYQQADRLVELREKTARTMCGIVTWNKGCRPYDPPMPIQAEAPREYLGPYMMNCTYKPNTEVSREQKRAIAELFVPPYKKYEMAYMTKKREVNVIVGPVLIKHALLHPTVNGPTRACSAYNKLCQLDAKNWWAVFREQDLAHLGVGGFNALERNQYSTMLPGYLSLGTSYTKIKYIVPSPTKILREPMPNEKYCIYAAFGGNTPTKSEVLDEQYDYVPPVHVICAADQVFINRKRKYKRTVSLYAQKNGCLIQGHLSMSRLTNTYC
jgi:hypothetical protein